MSKVHFLLFVDGSVRKLRRHNAGNFRKQVLGSYCWDIIVQFYKNSFIFIFSDNDAFKINLYKQ